MESFFPVIASLFPYAFIFLLSLLAISVARVDNYRDIFFQGLDRRDVALMGAFVIAGGILRFIFTLHIDLDPYGWRYLQDALSIKSSFLSLGNGIKLPDLAGALHIPGYAVFASIALLIRNSLFSVSLMNIIVSSLTVALAYVLTYAVTRERIASFFASALLAFSQIHTVYSGYEFPMSLSVFSVCILFLFFVCWLKSNNHMLIVPFLYILCVSVSIKIENIFLSVVFFPVFIYRFAKEGVARRGRKLVLRLATALSLVVFMFFCLPFIRNQMLKESSLLP